jgi:ribulose-bisphosphate carboxylase large chain
MLGHLHFGNDSIYFPSIRAPLCWAVTNILDMWRMLGRSLINGGLVVGTIIKSKLVCSQSLSARRATAFVQREIFHDQQQVFCQMNECIPEVGKAVRACIIEAGAPKKCFSANIAAG